MMMHMQKNMIRVVMKRQMNTKGWWMVMGGQIGYIWKFVSIDEKITNPFHAPLNKFGEL
jgi:nicotinamide riboside transporter PnuC